MDAITEDSATTGSESEIQSDLMTYQRYVDIVTFLSGISFPCGGDKLVPSCKNIYEGLPLWSPYLFRLPVWDLLDDTWTVLGPIMTNLPEMCPKLAVICGALGIDPNVFHSKRVMASTGLFPVVLTFDGNLKPHKSRFDSDIGDSHKVELSVSSSRVMTMARLNDFRDGVQCIEDSSLRIEIWKWLYKREDSAQNWFASELILIAALDDTVHFCQTAADESAIMLREVRGELTLELARLQCRRALLGLIEVEYGDNDSTWQLSVSSIVGKLSVDSDNNVEKVLKQLLESSIEVSWQLQLKLMSGGDSKDGINGLSHRSSETELLCSWDLTMTHLYPQVVKFLNRVAKTTENLISYCSRLDSHYREGNKAEKDIDSTSSLESIRHYCITKLLCDGLGAFPFLKESIISVVPEEKNSEVTSTKSSGIGMWSGILGLSESLVRVCDS